MSELKLESNGQSGLSSRTKQVALASAATLAVLSAVFIGANSVTAQSTGESIVDRISTRFNLSNDEVQAVFDEHKAERQEARAEKRAENLQAKVDDGTITAEQKTLIEEKFAELQAARQDLKDSDLTREEMKAQMESTKAELEAWAEDNGISLEDIRPSGENKLYRGFRGGHRF